MERRIRTLLVALVFLLAAGVPAFGHTQTQENWDSRHSLWTEFLQLYVEEGKVSYSDIQQGGQDRLNRYLSILGGVSQSQYDSWAESEKIAFWINVYNAFTIRLILDHYPLKSIRSIGFLPGAAFRSRFIVLPSLRGKSYSLSEVEHSILRKEFSEPRIHFAIVCASVSCPILRSEAYRGQDLDTQLDDAARVFLNDSDRNRVEGNTLKLSMIFRWFAKDFLKAEDSLASYVSQYLLLKDKLDVYNVEYLKYDWDLNE